MAFSLQIRSQLSMKNVWLSPTALAKICFSYIVINSAKIPLYKYAPSLRNLNFLEHLKLCRTYAQYVTEGGAGLNIFSFQLVGELETKLNRP